MIQNYRYHGVRVSLWDALRGFFVGGVAPPRRLKFTARASTKVVLPSFAALSARLERFTACDMATSSQDDTAHHDVLSRVIWLTDFADMVMGAAIPAQHSRNDAMHG